MASRFDRFLRKPFLLGISNRLGSGRSRAGHDELLTGPIRGNLLGAEHLVERAEELSRAQRLLPTRRSHGRARPLVRLEETRRVLADSRVRLAAAAERELDIGSAGEWLLDNYHVVQTHIHDVREGLPRDYYRELPAVADGVLAGYPRAYELAITLISHSEARIDPSNVELFVDAFQRHRALWIGELWALPTMLGLGLIESVRRMTLRTVHRLNEVEKADRWAARIHAASDEGSDVLGREMNALLAGRSELTADFSSRLLHQLRLARGSFPPYRRLEERLAEEGLTAADAAARVAQRMALTQVMMGNSIMSMRSIATIDWRALVERQSRMEAVLREDPSGVYERMTFDTRDQYRHAVERIARRSPLDEVEVARAAIAKSRSADPLGPAHDLLSHVGYHLVDDGVGALEQQAGYRSPVREKVRRAAFRHPDAMLGGGIALATGLALFGMLRLADAIAWPLAWLFVLLPALDVGVGFVFQLVTWLLKPAALPKLELRLGVGVPASLRTVVVMPTLFGSARAVREALDNLEVQYLANRDAHVHFAILSDFNDASTETCVDDDAVLALAVDGVRALNAQYAQGNEDAFFLFHRSRQWNPQEGTWMGWERKRGKLAEFTRFVRSTSMRRGSERGAQSGFSTIVGRVEPLRQARYVITLDADTMLPPDAAPLLIGTMAHPLNRAVYDTVSGRVVKGYAILQPRVGVSLPSAAASSFARLYSGLPGVDPYTSATSDVYQDLYGEGSFTGKGIYEIDAFETATSGRFPENTLLSHDLIEGSYARAGLMTDVIVYDDFPSRYLTHTRRKHRWIRGDWQLLGWLTRYVPGPQGRERNRLSRLSRWKILDNLRRSTVELAVLALLVGGWTVLPGSPLRWTAVALTAVGAPWILSLALALLQPPFDRSWAAYYGAVRHDAWVSVRQFGLTIAFLPHQAWISIDAIARTLWRMSVSRRHLLEWQTASRAERSASTAAGDTWQAMWPAVFIAAMAGTLALVLAFARPATLSTAPTVAAVAAVVLPFLLLWCASPAIAHLVSAAAPPEHALRASDRERAIRYAAHHWRYFERFVTAESHWLVPDNYQDDPSPVVAMRTSPTNIGLQLLATVSARDLGLIDSEEMLSRLELAFETLDRLPRHRGHFYNWYDLRDLRVLEPAYVSTVDSGNLAGQLIALRHACDALPDDAPEIRDRLTAIGARAYDMALAMDFSFLFDDADHLLAIGWQQSSRALDESRYDLLASEARLASFVAIAKNDVPMEHWFRLGRSLTRAGGAAALVSWSGSMFEYLMPGLVMQSFDNTLLDASCTGAVRRQIAHGALHGVPWGVSESAYNVRDAALTYQYRAFGVPDLALKRGLERELVIAPYASVLAVMVDPPRALANLARLEALGALGPYGFRDAIDYTRPLPDRPHALVGTYMAHHVGMSLIALTNALTNNVWQRRFHADALVRAAALLLYERFPRRLWIQPSQETRDAYGAATRDTEQPTIREIDTPHTPHPEIALLGQPPYTVMVSHAGGGYSRYNDMAVLRWRADATLDDRGQFCYVKDIATGRLWSATHQPVCAPTDSYHALLASDRVTFHRTDGDIETRLEIVVVPQDAAEVRRVSLTNTGDEPRDIELTSYAEVVLGSGSADRAHPAFANLFIETEWHAWCTAITATRRARSSNEMPLFCAHVVDAGPDRLDVVSCETNRATFLGRGRTCSSPAALDAAGALSGGTGAVLDPIFALRTRVRIPPGQTTSVSFTTLVATTREQLFELAGRYHDAHSAQRALDLGWISTQVELRELGITAADSAIFQELAGHLIYSRPDLRAPASELFRNRGAQPRLWAQGISGDWPILLATIDSSDGLPTLRQLLLAHHLWKRRGMTVDLVVLNEHAVGYLQELEEQISASLSASGGSASIRQAGGVFPLRRDMLDANDLLMLRATARVQVPCDGRSLGRILQASKSAEPAPTPRETPSTPQRWLERRPHATGARTWRYRSPETAMPALSRTSMQAWEDAPFADAGDGAAAAGNGRHDFDNGFGRLTAGDDYEIRVSSAHLPPAPWANVIANPAGGFVVTESGGGFTWAESSFHYRLTPWHNDPVSDPAGEAIYLRDEDTGEVWGATPAPLHDGGSYTVVHAPGTSRFEHERHGIASQLTLGMARHDAVKLSILRVTNRGTRARRLVVTPYAEWTLGVAREQTQHQVVTDFDAEHRAVFAQNFFAHEWAHLVSFFATSERVTSHTADRAAFIGRNGSLRDPVALREDALAIAAGAGLDPCAALRCEIELVPGETRVIVVALGAANGREAAQRLVREYTTPESAERELAASVAAWNDRLSVLAVRTPDRAFDAMVNRWSLYQALSCRMWARSALYQSGGAYGFRDQLQDVMAFVYAEPKLARDHIVRAAARQFVEGDVQHWWHPHSGRGVRTRFSDDLVWLPYVVEHYVRSTGDTSVLDETVPYLLMRDLRSDEHEVYDVGVPNDEGGTVYEHCVRALEKACTTGAHGMPLIGDGDWNDGFNRVGAAGKGESVWLAWFLTATLRAFATLSAARGDDAFASTSRSRADAYAAAVDEYGWDGAWYRRAYFDDGSPLGSAANAECRIDSIAQSWSVISGAGASDRQAIAMRSLEDLLIRDDDRLLLLLAPPFDKSPSDPGYIKGYLPGVRENGAQYTHAALWAVLATALRGDGTRAFELFQMLNPLSRTRTADDVATYMTEPYAVAADVYAADRWIGRGGWTWYTGSASWMYRVALESLLGFTKRGDTLMIRPCVPDAWADSGYTITYRHGSSTYTIAVQPWRQSEEFVAQVSLDGRELDGPEISLVDDGGAHQVIVRGRAMPVEAASSGTSAVLHRDA